MNTDKLASEQNAGSKLQLVTRRPLFNMGAKRVRMVSMVNHGHIQVRLEEVTSSNKPVGSNEVVCPIR